MALAKLAMPASSSISFTRWCRLRASRRVVNPALRGLSPNATFLATFRWGNNAASCGTSPILRWFGGTEVLLSTTRRPPSSTVPPLAASSPAMTRSSVDLPQPEGPRIAKSSPLGTSRVIPSSTRLARLRCPLVYPASRFVTVRAAGSMLVTSSFPDPVPAATQEWLRQRLTRWRRARPRRGHQCRIAATVW